MASRRYTPYNFTEDPAQEKAVTKNLTHNEKQNAGTFGKFKFNAKKKSKEEKKAYEEKRMRTPDKRFGGLTEEDVKKLVLPDHLAANLDILFIGINPGLMSAYKGHHYCGANNHFWPLLYDSGLIGEPLTYAEDRKCLDYGIGLTNIVARTTRSAAELSREEIKAGVDSCMNMINDLKPLVVCFNGKGIYEIFSDQKKCNIGRQQNIGNTAVYVMPSTSGLVAQYPRKQDKLVFFEQLKALRDEQKTNGKGESSALL